MSSSSSDSESNERACRSRSSSPSEVPLPSRRHGTSSEESCSPTRSRSHSTGSLPLPPGTPPPGNAPSDELLIPIPSGSPSSTADTESMMIPYPEPQTEIPLPETDDPSRYSPTQALQEQDMEIDQDDKKELEIDKKPGTTVLGKAQAKKRLLAFSAAKSNVSSTTGSSFSLTFKAQRTPTKSPIPAPKSLAIEQIKEEETRLKEAMAMNSLLTEKLNLVRQVADINSTLPTISSPTTSTNLVVQSLQRVTGVVKPIANVSPIVSSTSSTIVSASAATTVTTHQNPKVEHAENEVDSSPSPTNLPSLLKLDTDVVLPVKVSDKKDRSERDRDRERDRMKDPSSSHRRGSSRDRDRDRDRDEGRERERRRREDNDDHHRDNRRSAKDRDREGERRHNNERRRSRSRERDRKYSEPQHARRERDRERDRDRNRRENESPVDRRSYDRNRESERVPRNVTMPSDWSEYKQADFSNEKIRAVWGTLESKRRRKSGSAESDGPSSLPHPAKLTTSLHRPLPIHWENIIDRNNQRREYPAKLIKYTNTRPKIKYGPNPFNDPDYYVSREEAFKRESHSPEIRSAMDEIICQQGSTSELSNTKKVQKRSSRDWWATSENEYCPAEGSKKVLISHLYSDDEDKSEQREPEKVTKFKKAASPKPKLLTNDKREPSTTTSSSLSPKKPDSEESAMEEESDSTPSPLLKRKYDDISKDEPSPFILEKDEEFIVSKPSEVLPSPKTFTSPEPEPKRKRADEDNKKRKKEKLKKLKKKRKKIKHRDSSEEFHKSKEKKVKKAKKTKKKESSSDSSESDIPSDSSKDKKKSHKKKVSKEKKKKSKKSPIKSEPPKKHRKDRDGDDENGAGGGGPAPRGRADESSSRNKTSHSGSSSSRHRGDESSSQKSRDRGRKHSADTQDLWFNEEDIVNGELLETKIYEEMESQLTAHYEVQETAESVLSACDSDPLLRSIMENGSESFSLFELCPSEVPDLKPKSKSENLKDKQESSSSSSSSSDSSSSDSDSSSSSSDEEVRSSKDKDQTAATIPVIGSNIQYKNLDLYDPIAAADNELDESYSDTSGYSTLTPERSFHPVVASSGLSPPRRLSLDERLELEMGIQVKNENGMSGSMPPGGYDYYSMGGNYYYNTPAQTDTRKTIQVGNLIHVVPTEVAPGPTCSVEPIGLPNGFHLPNFNPAIPPPFLRPHAPQFYPLQETKGPKPASEVTMNGDMLTIVPTQIPPTPIKISATVQGNGEVVPEVVSEVSTNVNESTNPERRQVKIKIPILPFCIPVLQVPISSPKKDKYEGMTPEEIQLRRKEKRKLREKRKAEKGKLESTTAATTTTNKETPGEQMVVDEEELAILKEAMCIDILSTIEEETIGTSEGEDLNNQLDNENEEGFEDIANAEVEADNTQEALQNDVTDVPMDTNFKIVDSVNTVVEDSGVELSQEMENKEEIPKKPIEILPPPDMGILVAIGFRERSSGTKKSVKFVDGVVPGNGSDSEGESKIPSPPPTCSQYPYKKSFTKNKDRTKKLRKTFKIKAKNMDEINLPPPPPPKESYPYCPLGVMYQVAPHYAVLVAQVIAENGIDIILEPSMEPPTRTSFPVLPPSIPIAEPPMQITQASMPKPSFVPVIHEIQPMTPPYEHPFKIEPLTPETPNPVPAPNPKPYINSPNNPNLLIISPTKLPHDQISDHHNNKLKVYNRINERPKPCTTPKVAKIQPIITQKRNDSPIVKKNHESPISIRLSLITKRRQSEEVNHKTQLPNHFNNRLYSSFCENEVNNSSEPAPIAQLYDDDILNTSGVVFPKKTGIELEDEFPHKLNNHIFTCNSEQTSNGTITPPPSSGTSTSP